MLGIMAIVVLTVVTQRPDHSSFTQQSFPKTMAECVRIAATVNAAQGPWKFEATCKEG